jgi:hypothetical protein
MADGMSCLYDLDQMLCHTEDTNSIEIEKNLDDRSMNNETLIFEPVNKEEVPVEQ